MTASAAPLHPVGDRPLLAVLAGIAGFVDTAGFIALAGLFTAHVTGNFVLAGAAAADAEPGIGVRLAMFPLFAMAVAGSAVLVRRAPGRYALRRLLAVEAVLLAVLAAGGALLGPSRYADVREPAVLLLGAAGVLAMGVQNALMRLQAASLPASTVMTGNFTALVADLTLGTVAADEAERRVARERARRVLPAVTGFLAGAVLGAVGIHLAGFAAIALPSAAAAMLALTASPSPSHE